jgi:hypothetical protein
MQSEIYPDDADLILSSCDDFRFVAGSPMKHILAPTELAPKSRESVARAVWLARRFGANVASDNSLFSARQLKVSLAWSKQ